MGAYSPQPSLEEKWSGGPSQILGASVHFCDLVIYNLTRNPIDPCWEANVWAGHDTGGSPTQGCILVKALLVMVFLDKRMNILTHQVLLLSLSTQQT